MKKKKTITKSKVPIPVIPIKEKREGQLTVDKGKEFGGIPDINSKKNWLWLEPNMNLAPIQVLL